MIASEMEKAIVEFLKDGELKTRLKIFEHLKVEFGQECGGELITPTRVIMYLNKLRVSGDVLCQMSLSAPYQIVYKGNVNV